MRDPEQHPRLRSLVGSAHLAPLVPSALEASGGRFPVPLRQFDPAGRDVDGGVEGEGAAVSDLVRVDDRLEFVERPSRSAEIVRGDGDLDLGGKMAESLEGIGDLLESALDASRGRIDLALGKAEEREPGLRISAELVGGTERCLRAWEVATLTADLADLVVPSSGDLAVEVLELVTCSLRLDLGRRPVAPEAQDLGSVNSAGARKAVHIELIAPAIRYFRPLGGTSVVTEVAARADGDAVDEPRCVRSNAARGRERRCLVEQSEPLVDPSGHDPRPTLPGDRKCLNISVADAPTELEGLAEQGLGQRRGRPRRTWP